MSKKIDLDWRPVQVLGERGKTHTYHYIEGLPNCVRAEYMYEGMEPNTWSSLYCADHDFARDAKGEIIRNRTAEGIKYEIVQFGQEMFRLHRWNKAAAKSEDTGWMTREELLEKVSVRPKQSEAKAWNKWVDDIKVGDFVRCKGQRTASVWKKILVINPETFVAMQYKKPIDDTKYVHGYSSETLIMNIKEKYVP